MKNIGCRYSPSNHWMRPSLVVCDRNLMAGDCKSMTKAKRSNEEKSSLNQVQGLLCLIPTVRMLLKVNCSSWLLNGVWSELNFVCFIDRNLNKRSEGVQIFMCTYTLSIKEITSRWQRAKFDSIHACVCQSTNVPTPAKLDLWDESRHTITNFAQTFYSSHHRQRGVCLTMGVWF